ncbi:MAG: hypothetical protein U0R64_01925 [Candidatus Nanopelagicales bacterium]
MARKPGRDKLVATRRLIRLLSLLAQVSPNWKLRDLMITELEYRDARPKDSIARDIRRLRERGWAIETRGSGTTMAHRLLDQDPRLNTLLTPGERLPLSRAVVLSGNDPADRAGRSRRRVAQDATSPRPSPARIVEEALHALKHRCPCTSPTRTVPAPSTSMTCAARTPADGGSSPARTEFKLLPPRPDHGRPARPAGSASPPQPVARMPTR